MNQTILCIASYEKGQEFLREAKRQGARVLLLTSLSLKDEADWPREALDDIFYMPDVDKQWNRADTLKAVAHLARREKITRLVPLDDFDLEMAAFLREHLRIPGMGETTVRYFRDKLAMRMKAEEAGLNIPDYTSLIHDADVAAFIERVPGPWVLKPRFLAGAIGIKKVRSAEELWPLADALGDERSYYLLERFVEGDIAHVDSIVTERTLRFAVASRYGKPPLEVSHGGGIFSTQIVERGSDEEARLLEKNARVLAALGLVQGVSHTEFILGRDGVVYFLETSARVGGAHIADLVEAATGLNLWAEWAKVELDAGRGRYKVTPARAEYAGLLVSLAKQEWPELGGYNDPEVVWRMKKKHHAGLIVRSGSAARVRELIEAYTGRFAAEFMASLPARERPTD